MVTFLRFASNSSAYWYSMLKKETSVKYMGQRRDLNSLRVMMHLRQTQIILAISFRRSCRYSRCRNSCYDNYSICTLLFTTPVGVEACSVRNHPRTESRMTVALGFSRAILRTLSRDGDAASGGEYSLARQRLRSSSNSGAWVMMSCRTLRKVEMERGAVLGESRHAKRRVRRWSQVSVFWICENRATECLWNCWAVSIFIIYSKSLILQIIPLSYRLTAGKLSLAQVGPIILKNKVIYSAPLTMGSKGGVERRNVVCKSTLNLTFAYFVDNAERRTNVLLINLNSQF